MENTPYEVAEYLIRNNPKAITAMLWKYGYNPIKVSPTPTLILKIISDNGQLAVVDLFESYWDIVKNRLPKSYDGINYAALDVSGNVTGAAIMGPPAPSNPPSQAEVKKNFWEKFTDVFGAITGGVNAASGLINIIKQPKQQPVQTQSGETIMGLSKPLFFGVVILIVVMVIAVIAKSRK